MIDQYVDGIGNRSDLNNKMPSIVGEEEWNVGLIFEDSPMTKGPSFYGGAFGGQDALLDYPYTFLRELHNV